jgi:hypothetical protein
MSLTTHVGIAANTAVKLSLKSMPMSTSITNMLTPQASANLTPEVKALTKADLITLQMGGHNAATAALTTADIKSVQTAFAQGSKLNPGIAAGDINCCCCPCCCATAVLEPVAAVA